MRLWHVGPGPLSLDELWCAYLRRFDIEHAIRTLKGTLGLTAAKVRTPQQADRWVRVVTAAQAQLLLARPPTFAAPGESPSTPAGRCPRAGPPGVSATSTLASAPRTVSRNSHWPGQAQGNRHRAGATPPFPRRRQHAASPETTPEQGKVNS
jgi:hypothetical protein